MAGLNLHFTGHSTCIFYQIIAETGPLYSDSPDCFFYTAFSRNVWLSAASVSTPFKNESQEYMQLEGMCSAVRHTNIHTHGTKILLSGVSVWNPVWYQGSEWLQALDSRTVRGGWHKLDCCVRWQNKTRCRRWKHPLQPWVSLAYL